MEKQKIEIDRAALKMLFKTIIRVRAEIVTEVLDPQERSVERLHFKLGLISENLRLMIHNIIKHMDPNMEKFVEECMDSLSEEELTMAEDSIKGREALHKRLRESFPLLNSKKTRDYMG